MKKKFFLYKFDCGTFDWYFVSGKSKEKWGKYDWIYAITSGTGEGPHIPHESNHPTCMWLKERVRLQPVSALEILTVLGRTVESLVERMK